MRLEIAPFTNEHLTAAAELLAARHRADRERMPLLSPRFGEPAVAQMAVEEAWRAPQASGVVMLEADRVVGDLIGAPQIDEVRGRTAWISRAGYALASGQSAEVYRDLYAALSPQWLTQGLFSHYALISAGDQAALAAWFALSFGQEHCYGLRALTEADVAPGETTGDPSLTIRRATRDDLDAMIPIADTIPRYQAGSPVYAPFVLEAMWPKQLLADYTELVSNPQVALWLALRDARIVGYQLYIPE
ncbi:MAG TPA: hypothetical protein VKQ36_02170, partial [Ktedonobacterales bacterium]|nr:hypothetical protein [Ktedonobacterales bacterium]